MYDLIWVYVRFNSAIILLKEEGVRFYDVGDKYDIVALETDYNDELLDGGYWMIVLYAINNDIVNEHFNL